MVLMKLLYLQLLCILIMSAGCSGAGSQMPQDNHHQHTNRLVDSSSPYLLQHAHNPVDWYPWGEEALERARGEGKPIFLSIGYSACHWCHVMERESFEDERIAELLNEHFVCIKVDREERPDVDEIYMTAVQLMTGRGGWPLSVFLSPDLVPFFGGTYFPPESKYGQPGFRDILTRIVDAWENQRDALDQSGEQLLDAIEKSAAASPSVSKVADLKSATVREAVQSFVYTFDAIWGGFGGAPKFPQTGLLSLVLAEYSRTGSPELLNIVKVSLDRMAYGGVYDQLGGGFHRYSVDREWLVPHFEKMLYDNALLSYLYLEAYQVTGDNIYAAVARETLDYVLRDMLDESGGFHSAEDADSEGVEGKFYVWSEKEIKEILGDSDAELFNSYYGVTLGGNFEGENILNVAEPLQEFAAAEGKTAEPVEDLLKRGRKKLLEARAKRVRPGKDDKVLVSWNGLMISSLTKAYQVLGEKKYLDAAAGAGEFLLESMIRDGLLMRSYRRGVVRYEGYLADYAFAGNAFIDLYESTFDEKWVGAADRLAAKMQELFGSEEGGYHFTSEQHKNLIVRTRPFYDGSIPSGNSIAAMLLLRLGKILGRDEYTEAAERILTASDGRTKSHPSGFSYMLKALDFYTGGTQEFLIIAEGGTGQAEQLIELVRKSYAPQRVIIFGDASGRGVKSPLLEGRAAVDGRPTLYICENNSCKKPMTNLAEIANILRFAKD
jgi:uncharacterized protein YyaL (SSP411 family)